MSQFWLLFLLFTFTLPTSVLYMLWWRKNICPHFNRVICVLNTRLILQKNVNHLSKGEVGSYSKEHIKKIFFSLKIWEKNLGIKKSFIIFLKQWKLDMNYFWVFHWFLKICLMIQFNEKTLIRKNFL